MGGFDMIFSGMICSKVRVFLILITGITLASTGLASAQIVALGSSTVHGAVAESEMWPAVLEGMLRAKGSQVHVMPEFGERLPRERFHAFPAFRMGPGPSS